MNSESAAAPVRAGTFEQMPFVHLLLELGRSGADGTLVVQHAGRQTKVLLRAGRPVAAGPLERGASLEQGLMPLCALVTGSFRLSADDLVGQAPGFTWGGFDPLVFLRVALRDHVPQAVVDALLERHAGRVLRLSPGIDAKALGLQGRDALLVDRLRRGADTVESLTSDAEWSEPRARRLVCLLLVTGSANAQSGEGATGSSHLRMRAVAVATEATVGASVPSGYPSMRPSGGLAAWQQLAARRASSAPPVPPARAASIPALAPQENVEQAVERLLRARDPQGALKLARRAVADHPDGAAAQALLCWALLHAEGTDSVGSELIDTVNRALRLDPEQPRALYTKALAYRRMGREQEALRYFQRTVRADPQHIDARRELRLAQMRGTIGKPPKKR